MAPILPLKITHPVCWAELYLKISKHTKEMFTARLFRTRPGPHASIFRRPACRSITRHGYVFVSRDHLRSDSFDERFLAWYPKIFNYISRASWKPVQVQNKRVLLNSRRKLIRFLIFFLSISAYRQKFKPRRRHTHLSSAVQVRLSRRHNIPFGKII